MVAVTSTMLALGTQAPDFHLPDTNGDWHRMSQAVGAPTVVMFICNHCPFVKLVVDELAALARDYAARGVRFFAISSNDIEAYPQDGPEAMKAEAERRGYTFPYLLDESQDVAKSYMAACTPDFFLFDADHRLVYRGQLDDARPSNGVRPSGADLRAAVDAVLAGRSPSPDQKPAMGCNIKWKPGNHPNYFGA
ncbi:MAG: thioredoxin family protein [Rhodothermales bacterium]|nr:thioredoxin family protein [Rhodothermales bacterium]MBO6779320.1 thioredoxin family protein [Rhodothermales bacterium]